MLVCIILIYHSCSHDSFYPLIKAGFPNQGLMVDLRGGL